MSEFQSFCGSFDFMHSSIFHSNCHAFSFFCAIPIKVVCFLSCSDIVNPDGVTPHCSCHAAHTHTHTPPARQTDKTMSCPFAGRWVLVLLLSFAAFEMICNKSVCCFCPPVSLSVSLSVRLCLHVLSPHIHWPHPIGELRATVDSSCCSSSSIAIAIAILIVIVLVTVT